MYLQSLEILGFKSFAQKTILNFHRGVTAIVGPNGCGKSNVLDAIRWVLGEQSAKALRGGEMADVIFSGTDSRQAVGMAEVSMTFAECEKELGVDWNEVRITRRVHRDGHSEYFLNKAPCRLRDIHQLFMDTGIGRSAYSIMEQGKIDLILSSRPEDRRAIFEEAAGITKFKSQKKEALRKLEYTEANLLRVTDIIKEVKRQIGSLQRQAGKARRYQSLAADLKTFETHLNHQQFAGLKAALDSARAEIERLNAVQAEQQESVEGQETNLASRRHELDQMEERLAEARQAVQDLKNQVQNAENRIGFNTERISEFQGLIERYERDIAAADEKLKVQEDQIHHTDAELEQIAGTLAHEQNRLNEKLAAAQEISGRRVAAENEIQSLFNGISRTDSKINSLRNQSAAIVTRREGQDTRLGILIGEIEQLSASAGRFAGRKQELETQLGAIGEELEAHSAEVRANEATLNENREQLRSCEQELHRHERSLTERESKLEALKQLNEAGEGFTAGTQAVLRGLDNPDFFKPAIQGALASQIDVEPQFIPAIEGALGHHLQAILLKDTMIAESVVKTLVGQKLGRASLAVREFLPAFAAEAMPELPSESPGWVLDKIRASGEVATLLSHLLHGCALAPDIDTAMRLRAAHPGLSFVTLAGESISREGVVQGGQGGDTAGSVLHRKAQILAIAAEVEEGRRALADLQKRRDDLVARVEATAARLQEAREETQRLNVTVSTLRSERALVEREEREANAKRVNLEREKEKIESQQQEAADQLARLQIEAEEAARELALLQEQQAGSQSDLEALRSGEAELVAEVNELKIKVATERQRHDSLRNQRQPMAARLQELRDLIRQRQHDIEGYQAKIARLTEESQNIRTATEAARTRIDEAEENVRQLLEERAGIVTNIDELDAELRILRRQLNENHDRRSQQEVKQTQLQLRIENLCEHIQRRYQLDLRAFEPDSYSLLCSLRDQKKRQARLQSSAGEETPAQPATEEETPAVSESEQRIDWTLVETFVREIDQKIESMGPINIDAIQEYDELEQRHTFLETQLNDLTASKTELLDVIARINTTTRELFADTFEKVRGNFQEMFTELFGGGKANLILVDESDPLESGIDIIAKPPGKQLQSVSLLSGGERTMTAVALLFAIYMVKPSPFCVLDEMDAPLDESNINRFIKILDRFVSQSQFVVITHNKRTIAKADVLYGVTMEEHGVSKLVGVRFARREDSGEKQDIIGTRNPAPIPSIAESFGKSGDLASEAQAG